MSWTDQDPPADNVLLQASLTHRNQHVRFEIDKLADGTYRATAGNLFGSQEITRHRNIEMVLHAIQQLWDAPLC